MAGKLILCRHGQSDWNLKNLFTGWTDVDLTEKGIEEALEAGRTVAALDYDIDIAYTSVLRRCLRLVEALQRAVMALVEPPVAHHR